MVLVFEILKSKIENSNHVKTRSTRSMSHISIQL